MDKGAYVDIRQRRALQRTLADVDPIHTPNLFETPDPIEEGDLWYDAELDSFKGFIGGTIVRIGGTAFISLGDSDYISNTTAETKFDTINPSTLKFTLDHDTLDKKREITIRAEGDYSDTGTPTLTIKLKYNNITMYSLGAVTLGSGVSNKQWYAEFSTVIRLTDSAVRAYTFLDQGRLDNAILAGTLSAVDLNADTDYNITISVQWSAASASNKVRMRRFRVAIT